MDFIIAKPHLKKSKTFEIRVIGSYNLYLIILGTKNEAIKAIKNHHRYVKLKENL